MSGLCVIVDDRDSAITWSPMTVNGGGPYGSGWTFDGVDAEFRNTTTKSGYTSSTMNFPFNGTSISVYATLDNYPISTYNFTVDGGHAKTWAQNAPSPTFHQEVYSSGTLDDGEHQLQLTLVSANDTGSSLDNFFDYIIYEPSQNTSLSNGSPYLFVDDTSPFIHYSSSGWTQNSPSNFNAESFMSYNNSINMASSVGAQATIYFEGTVLEAWGAIPTTASQTTIASYTLDEGVSSMITIPASTASSNNVAGGLAWNYHLFTVTPTSGGVHTLTLTALQPDLLYLDFFLVTSPTAFIPSGNSTLTSTPTGPSSKGNSHIGAIVGGVVGGIVFIGLLLLAFLYRRRRRHEGQFDPPDPSKVNYGRVMNTYQGDSLPYAPSYPTTDVNTTSLNHSSSMYTSNQSRYDGPQSPNNPSDSSSYGVAPYGYGEGQSRDRYLSQGSSSGGAAPPMPNIIQSPWSPPATSAATSPNTAALPPRPMPVPPVQQAGQPQGPGAGKISVVVNGVREHESATQEQDSGYRGPIDTVLTAPPSYTPD